MLPTRGSAEKEAQTVKKLVSLGRMKKLFVDPDSFSSLRFKCKKKVATYTSPILKARMHTGRKEEGWEELAGN